MVTAAIASLAACTSDPDQTPASDIPSVVTLVPAGTPTGLTVNGTALAVVPLAATPTRVITEVCPAAAETTFTLADGTSASFITSEIWFQRPAPAQFLYGEERPVVLCLERMQRLDPETGTVETILTADEEALDARLEGVYGEPILWGGLYGGNPVGLEQTVLFPFQGASQIGVSSIAWQDAASEILVDIGIPSGTEITDVIPAVGGMHFLPIVEDTYQRTETDADWYYRPVAYAFYDQETARFSPVINLPELPDLTDEVTDDGIAFAELSEYLYPYFRDPTVVGNAVWLPFGASLMDEAHFLQSTDQSILRFDLDSGEELPRIDLDGFAFGSTNLMDAPLRELAGTDYAVGITTSGEGKIILFFDQDGRIVKQQDIGEIDTARTDPIYSTNFLSRDGHQAMILGDFYEFDVASDSYVARPDIALTEISAPTFPYTWLEEGTGEIHEYAGYDVHDANIDSLVAVDDRLMDAEQLVEDPDGQRIQILTGQAGDYVIVDTQADAAYALTLPLTKPCYIQTDGFSPLGTCPIEGGLLGGIDIGFGWQLYHPVTIAQDKVLIGFGTDVLVYDLPD